MARKSKVERAHEASIPVARKSKPLPRAVLSKLGRIPDTDVARLFNLHAHVVRRERISRGIYAFQRMDWTPDKIKLLGTMSDEQVARKLGVGSTTVFSKRTGLRIPAFGRSFEETRHVLEHRRDQETGDDAGCPTRSETGCETGSRGLETDFAGNSNLRNAVRAPQTVDGR